MFGLSNCSFRQWNAAFPLMCGGPLFTKKSGIRCLTGKTPDIIGQLFTTAMWPTVMQLAFCGQLVFCTSLNTKRLQTDCKKEITLKYAVSLVGIRPSW